MNEVEWLKSLDNPQPSPAVDVVPGVMLAIQTAVPDSARIYQYAAAVAVVVGLVALAAGLPALLSGADPLSGMFEAFNPVLQ